MTATSETRTAVQRRGDEARAAILEAALSLYARNGFSQTSVASVAEAVGMSQPGLLHHFPSKNALLLAALAKIDEQDPMDPLPESHGLDVLDKYRASVHHDQLNLRDRRAMSVLAGEAVTEDHPAQPYFVKRFDDLRRGIAAEFQLAQGSGEVSHDVEPEVIASILIGVMDGLQLQLLLDPSLDREHCFEVFTDLLRRALVPDAPKALVAEPKG